MSVVVRKPAPEEMRAVGKLAADMVRMHHVLDPKRFLLVEPIEAGYTRFLTSMVDDPRSVVLAAVDDDLGVVGYAYGRLESRDWNRLLDEHGKLHDIAVDERARQRGVGALLGREVLARLRAMGAKRIMLDTAWSNEGAQRLFKSLGFRPTMIEMQTE